MDELEDITAKWNKAVIKRQINIWFHLSEVPRIVKFTEAESRQVAAKNWGKEEIESCLKDMEFQFCKKSPENYCT
jgi:hypothetical protein